MYNRELLQIDNSNKAYLLGLMYSDGNLSSKGYLSRIQLKNTDKELLDKIVKEFSFFKIYNKRKDSITIWCSSKLLWSDFKLHGLIERKSFENADKLKFPKINKSFYFDFIRGYIDGNGSVNYNINKKSFDKKVYIYSVSTLLLRQIKFILYLNKIESRFIIDNRSKKFNEKIYTSILYSISIKPKNLKEFYNFLYKENSIYLKRKKDIFNLIYNSNFFIKSICPNCPTCKGVLVKNGINKYNNKNTQIYLCRICNKNIQESALISSNINNEEDELLES